MASKFRRLRDRLRAVRASRPSFKTAEIASEAQHVAKQRIRREMPRPSQPPAYTFAGAPWSADDIRRRRESGVYPRPAENTSTQASQTLGSMSLPTPPITPNLAPPPPYDFAHADPAWNFQPASTRQSTTTAPATNPQSAPPEYLIESLETVKKRLANLTKEPHPPFTTTWAQGRGNLHSQRLQNLLLHTIATCYNLSLSTRLTNEDSTYFALVAKFLKAHHRHEDLCISSAIPNPPVSDDHRTFAKILWSDPIASFGNHSILWAHAYEILITHGSRQGAMTARKAHATKLAQMAQLSRVDEYVQSDERLLEVFAPAGETRWKKDFEAYAEQLKGSAEIAGNLLLNEHLLEMARDQPEQSSGW